MSNPLDEKNILERLEELGEEVTSYLKLLDSNPPLPEIIHPTGNVGAMMQALGVDFVQAAMSLSLDLAKQQKGGDDVVH